MRCCKSSQRGTTHQHLCCTRAGTGMGVRISHLLSDNFGSCYLVLQRSYIGSRSVIRSSFAAESLGRSLRKRLAKFSYRRPRSRTAAGRSRLLTIGSPCYFFFFRRIRETRCFHRRLTTTTISSNSCLPHCCLIRTVLLLVLV
jgi:hypothetical protein